jgi:hypothetical protein|tara:strand:+ start:57 stop:512 length:456 start_codon:yes stop_codon:yes gene_type:complete
MKKNLITIVLLLFAVASCGYKPIFLNEKNDLNIEKIEIVKENRLNKLIKSNLENISNQDSENKISLLINSQKTKSVISKDAKGNVQLLAMSLSVDVKIYKNDKIKSEKKFFESFSYSNDSNKFNLSKYEKNIEKNLRNNIIKNIRIYLVSY